MRSQHVIILLSGGIDSTATLHFYVNLGYTVQTIYIKFGQIAAKKEWLAVRKINKYYNVKSQKIELDFSNNFKDGFIQGRNLFLVSAALLTGNISHGQIGIGIHYGTNYVDCSRGFLDKCNEIFTLYTGGKITLSAPFVDWTKKQIFDYCRLEKIPLELTYSCELGKNQPCGECSSCKELTALYETKNK